MTEPARIARLAETERRLTAARLRRDRRAEARLLHVRALLIQNGTVR